MENGVFKCVGLVRNVSAISKLHGMRDLVSPADALSLGAETLFVFLPVFLGIPIDKVSSLLSTELLL